MERDDVPKWRGPDGREVRAHDAAPGAAIPHPDRGLVPGARCGGGSRHVFRRLVPSQLRIHRSQEYLRAAP